jgi:hypothetical protein
MGPVDVAPPAHRLDERSLDEVVSAVATAREHHSEAQQRRQRRDDELLEVLHAT